MAKKQLGYAFTVDIAEAKKRVAEMKARFKELNDEAAKFAKSGAKYDPKPMTGYQQAQIALKKALADGQAEAQRLRNDILSLNAAYAKGKISAQELAAAEKQSRNERRALAEATKAARQAQVAASGSYDEAARKLRDLGRTIKAAEGGFKSTSPAIQAQVKEYNNLNNALKKFDGEMGNHQRNVGNYQNALNGVTGQLKGLVTGYLSIQGALALANKAFDVALSTDAIRTSLEFTFKSTTAVDLKMKDLKETADRLGLSFIPLAEGYTKFIGAAKAANFSLTDSEKIFNSVTGAAARFHLTSDQLNGSLLAIQQMISKGTVQSEELRGQLGERLPGAFSIAARAMDVTEKELGKMLQSGEVLASDLLPKLAIELDKTFNLDASTNIDSLTASTNRLSTAVDTAVQSDGVGKLFRQFIDGSANAVTALDRLLTSRSTREFFARITRFDVSNYDKSNDAADSFKTSQQRTATIKNPLSNDLETAKSNVEALRKSYGEAYTAYSVYFDLIKSGGVKNTEAAQEQLQTYRANAEDIFELLSTVNGHYQQSLQNATKGIKTLTDAQLTSLTAIRKRIAELSKLDGSAIDGSAIDQRIKALQARLKSGSLNSDSEIKARDALQKRIDDLTAKGTIKQKDADELEVESVRKKYADMLKAIEAFNNDPKNKKRGLKVNSSGLDRAQSNEVAAVVDKQETEKLKVTLDAQKKLYDDYEDYKAKVGEAEAKKRYGKELNNYDTYLEALKAKKSQLEGTDEKGKGGADPNSEANKLQLKFIDEQITKETALKEKRDSEAYAAAFNAALTHAQALIKIDTDYLEARKALGEGATKEQIDNLDRIREAKIKSENETNLDIITGWDHLFDNFDKMSRKAILKRLNDAKKLVDGARNKPIDQGGISQEDADGKLNTLNNAIASLDSTSSFKSVGEKLKKLFKIIKDGAGSSEEAKGALRGLLNDFSGLTEGISDDIGRVSSALESVGIGGEGLQDITKNIQGILGGLGTLSKGLASGNPVDIITGSIGLIGSAINLFNHKDKDLEKKISNYKKELNSLGQAYRQLERDVQTSVGNDYYTNSAKEIENLQQQQVKITQMRNAEEDKKKTDQSKIDAYNDQLSDIPNRIADIRAAMVDMMVQTDFKDLSASLADVFTTAFAAGENSLDSLNAAFDKVIANATKKGLELKFLQPAVDKFVNEFADYLKGNDGSAVGFDFQKYRDLLKDAGDKFTAGLDPLAEFFKNPNTDTTTSAVQKGIESITSTQASALEGIQRGQYEQQKKMVSLLTLGNNNWGKYFDIAMSSVRELEQINSNTANTVIELKNAIVELKTGHLKTIANNTKGGNGRDNGLGV